MKAPHVRVEPATALAEFALADASALRALQIGEASPDQQRRALDWILKKAAGIGALSFHPGDPHATSFKEGRRSVGLQMLRLITEPMDQLKKQATDA